MEPVTGMAALLSTIGSIVTSVVTWVTSFIGVITAEGNEFLLLMLLVPIIGFAVGILRRLINIGQSYIVHFDLKGLYSPFKLILEVV